MVRAYASEPTRRHASLTIETARPNGLPLKAERIQLVLLLDTRNRPYDFARETDAERRARLESGWRKRILGDARAARRDGAAA